MFFRRRPVLEVTLYERPGCHLCEDADRLLRRLQRRYRLRVRHVDITGDAELVRRYDIVIPVLTVGDTELTAPLTERAIRSALDKASGRLSA